jgi:DNA-binding response OmpR family regulator
MKNPSKVFSKRNIFESVSGEEYLSDDNTMNVHISNLRHKLREAGETNNYIETVYGMGYRLLKS